jgi:CubicO group peptidase (beta-lactamase class C family)
MLVAQKHMAHYVADRGFKYEPGTYWHYSSGDSNLLGWHLMNTFPSVCEFYSWQRRQWTQMGLKSVLIEPDNVGNMVFSSYGWATPRDWARWGNLQLSSTWATQTSKLVDVSLTTGKKKPYAGQFWLPQSNNSDFFNGFSAQGFEFQYTTMLPQHDLVVTQLACAKGDDYIQHMVPTLNSFLERVIAAIQ